MKSFLQVVLAILLFIALAVGAIMGIDKLLTHPSVVVTAVACDDHPCWNRISIGQEDPYAVFEIINSIEGIDKNSIVLDADREGRITNIYWYFERPSPDAQGVIYFEDDQVQAISILTVGSLNLGELIEKLGEPENRWTEIGRREYNEYLDITLFNLQKGYAAEVLIDLEGGENQVLLKESAPVFKVTYYDPAAFDLLLEGRILIDKPLRARTGTLEPWTGFGPIPVNRK